MNILVVDDEKNIAYAIAQIFEEQKWQVTMAYDGQEGLDLALSGYYDVAVLDIMLPGINGFEIVQKMRENKVDTPTLLLSALDEIPDILEGYFPTFIAGCCFRYYTCILTCRKFILHS